MSIEIKKGDKLKVRLVTNGCFSWFGDGRGVIVNAVAYSDRAVTVDGNELAAIAVNRGYNIKDSSAWLRREQWAFYAHSEVEIVKVLK